MFKGMEHPSAFPSMLRSGAQSQSQMDVRLSSPLSKRDNYGSTATLPSPATGLRRRESFGSNNLNRRDSFGSNTLLNGSLHNPRRDSFGSTLSRGDSLDLKVTKRDSFSGGGDLRRQSFGSSIYLRPDSAGQTNLIRRDSFGSQNLRKESFSNNMSRNSVPRDYVAGRPASQTVVGRTEVDGVCRIKSHNAIDGLFSGENGVVRTTNSILRKDSLRSPAKHVHYNEAAEIVAGRNKENTTAGAHKLTAANLTKHVTILEENLKNERAVVSKKLSFDEDNLSSGSNGRDRKNSHGSTGSYLASRRISIDSLETRRNSWNAGRRGSHASSGDFDVNKEFEELEVIYFLFYFI